MAVFNGESGAWLNALPISSLGLRMNDETVRIAIGLRLGAPHASHILVVTGANVDHFGTHGLNCRKSQGRHFHHSSLNDIIHRSLSSASVPSRLEPPGLFPSNGKTPDSMSIIPWSSGRLLVWDATCTDTFAYSSLSAYVIEAGAVALQAEKLKNTKYFHLDSTYIFIPVAVETCGSFGPQTKAFFKGTGSPSDISDFG